MKKINSLSKKVIRNVDKKKIIASALQRLKLFIISKQLQKIQTWNRKKNL